MNLITEARRINDQIKNGTPMYYYQGIFGTQCYEKPIQVVRARVRKPRYISWQLLVMCVDGVEYEVVPNFDYVGK